ncbi:MAG: hypothetical protein KA439_09755 [Rhizobacter sp.]|nr:hypothetical protein [Rhizobacter sp.]
MDLALRALHQIDSLLPIAQRLANERAHEPDAMLGLLGRIDQLNSEAMTMLDATDCDGDRIECTREAVLGREVAHG